MAKQKIRPASCRRCNYFGKFNFVPLVFAGGLTGLMVLSGILLSASASFAANTGNLQTTVNVAAACSLTVSPTSHTATINPGTTGSIGTSTVKSICNDPAGLAVYAVGYTDDTYGNNKLTATIAGNTYDISSNYTSSGTPLSSEWYMTLTPTTGTYTPSITTGFDSAHAVPNVYTKVAYRNTMTDIGENATGAQFTAAFNAYISLAQPAGSYTGKVKFLLIHPNVLTYDNQTGEPASYAPATIARDPELPVTFDMAYEDAGKTRQGDYYKLQDMTSAICSAVTNGQEGTVIDIRDNQTYKINKFKMNAEGTESACWMPNLNLGAETLTVSTLDSSNTNLPSDGTKDVSATTFSTWIKSSGTGSYTSPELIPVSDQDSYGNKYGTLYNYAAASANTINAAQGANNDNAQYSLCPSGWRLPIGGGSGEFQDFYNANSPTVTTMQSNYGFSLAGEFYDSTPAYQGSDGGYWSSTRTNGTNMRILSFDSSVVRPVSLDDRSYGLSVRCIAQ